MEILALTQKELPVIPRGTFEKVTGVELGSHARHEKGRIVMLTSTT